MCRLKCLQTAVSSNFVAYYFFWLIFCSRRVSLGDVTAHGRVQDWPSRERLGTRLGWYKSQFPTSEWVFQTILLSERILDCIFLVCLFHRYNCNLVPGSVVGKMTKNRVKQQQKSERWNRKGERRLTFFHLFSAFFSLYISPSAKPGPRLYNSRGLVVVQDQHFS